MLKTCKHSDCAVCKKIKEREIFCSILQTVHPEMFMCENAMYRITNKEGWKFIIYSLDCVVKSQKSYFVQDFYTSSIIYLNKDNFEVLCTKDGECTVTPYTREYIPGQKDKAAN